MKSNSLAYLLHAFFHGWMGDQRNLSRHTVCSYRDSWKLFLRFASEHRRREIVELSLADLQASEVLAFLEHLEKERKVSISTRNCRLAAIHSFFTFVAHREPLAIAQCAEIARIPVKKTSRPAMCYMDAEEITAILREPDRSRLEGQRDHALLGFLYNTGARIQEALDVCPRAIRFESPAQVELLGKGRKSRICPLWPETVAVLKALLRRQPRADDEPIFVNRYGQPIWSTAWRSRGSLQAQAIRPGGRQARAIARDKARHTAHLASQRGRSARRRRCRRDSDPQLARARAIGHDQSLRASQSGDQAKGARTSRSIDEAWQAPAVEAGSGTVELA